MRGGGGGDELPLMLSGLSFVSQDRHYSQFQSYEAENNYSTYPLPENNYSTYLLQSRKGEGTEGGQSQPSFAHDTNTDANGQLPASVEGQYLRASRETQDSVPGLSGRMGRIDPQSNAQTRQAPVLERTQDPCGGFAGHDYARQGPYRGQGKVELAPIPITETKTTFNVLKADGRLIYIEGGTSVVEAIEQRLDYPSGMCSNAVLWTHLSQHTTSITCDNDKLRYQGRPICTSDAFRAAYSCTRSFREFLGVFLCEALSLKNGLGLTVKPVSDPARSVKNPVGIRMTWPSTDNKVRVDVSIAKGKSHTAAGSIKLIKAFIDYVHDLDVPLEITLRDLKT